MYLLYMFYVYMVLDSFKIFLAAYGNPYVVEKVSYSYLHEVKVDWMKYINKNYIIIINSVLRQDIKRIFATERQDFLLNIFETPSDTPNTIFTNKI